MADDEFPVLVSLPPAVRAAPVDPDPGAPATGPPAGGIAALSPPDNASAAANTNARWSAHADAIGLSHSAASLFRAVRFRQAARAGFFATRATLSAVNAAGRTPLHVAAERGGYRGGDTLLRTLLDHGADANGTDRAGDTPLHLLSRSWKRAAVESARALVEVGDADVWAVNGAGDTPIDLARATAARALLPGRGSPLRPLPQIAPPLPPRPSHASKEAGKLDLLESLALARRRRIGYFGVNEANGDDVTL